MAYPVLESSIDDYLVNIDELDAPFPSGCVAGDLIVLQVLAVHSSSNPIINVPAGWTSIGTTEWGSGPSTVRTFYKFYQGTEGSTQTVTTNITMALIASSMVRYSGASGIGAIQAPANTSSGYDGETTSFTTQEDESLVVAHFVSQGFFAPNNMTTTNAAEQVDRFLASGDLNYGLHISTTEVALAGAIPDISIGEGTYQRHWFEQAYEVLAESSSISVSPGTGSLIGQGLSPAVSDGSPPAEKPPVGIWTGGAVSQIPGTTWTPPNGIFEQEDRNDDSTFGFSSSGSRITLPGSISHDGVYLMAMVEFEDTSNGRHTPSGRFVQSGGTGTFASGWGGGYNRDTSEDRSYFSAWGFCDNPSAGATFDFEWSRDTDVPTGGTVRATLIAVFLNYDDVGIYESTATTFLGGTSPNVLGGFSGTDGTDITLSAGTSVDLTADNKRYSVFGGQWFNVGGLGNRTQRWHGILEDSTLDHSAMAYTYYRNSANDRSGEIFSGLYETATATKTIEQFIYRGEGIANGNGGASSDVTTSANEGHHAMVVVQWGDSTKAFKAKGNSDQQAALTGPVDIQFGTPEIEDKESFDQSSATAVEVTADTDVLFGFNVNAASYNVGTGTRWTAHAELVVNDVEDTDYFAGDYLRNNQGSNDTFGWGANFIGVRAFTASDTFGVSVQELAGTEGGGDNVQVKTGWSQGWAIDLSTLTGSALVVLNRTFDANSSSSCSLTPKVNRVAQSNSTAQSETTLVRRIFRVRSFDASTTSSGTLNTSKALPRQLFIGSSSTASIDRSVIRRSVFEASSSSGLMLLGRKRSLAQFQSTSTSSFALTVGVVRHAQFTVQSNSSFVLESSKRFTRQLDSTASSQAQLSPRVVRERQVQVEAQSQFSLGLKSVQKINFASSSASSVSFTRKVIRKAQFDTHDQSALSVTRTTIRAASFDASTSSNLVISRSILRKRTIGIGAQSGTTLSPGSASTTGRVVQISSTPLVSLTRRVIRRAVTNTAAISNFDAAPNREQHRTLASATVSVFSLSASRIVSRPLQVAANSNVAINGEVLEQESANITSVAQSSVSITARVIRKRQLGSVSVSSFAVQLTKQGVVRVVARSSVSIARQVIRSRILSGVANSNFAVDPKVTRLRTFGAQAPSDFTLNPGRQLQRSILAGSISSLSIQRSFPATVLNTADDVYLGERSVQKIALGSNIVWIRE